MPTMAKRLTINKAPMCTDAFSLSDGIMTSKDIGTKGSKTAAYLKAMKDVKIEKVIIVDAPSAWAARMTVSVQIRWSKVCV